MFSKEKELFPPLKKYFNSLGYKVYAEVPYYFRGIDFVAVKEGHHIAVEMKMAFTHKLIWQAHQNRSGFHEICIAYPVKQPMIFTNADQYWKLSEKIRKKVEHCRNWGIGIFQVLPKGTIFSTMEAESRNPHRVFDFSQYTESDDDEAGLPYQKGVSAGYYELEAIKAYVRQYPNADWKEIYANVQNHYSSPASLAGSMRQWRGFQLQEFRKSLPFSNPLKTKEEESRTPHGQQGSLDLGVVDLTD
jgi:hypothetical protein